MIDYLALLDFLLEATCSARVTSSTTSGFGERYQVLETARDSGVELVRIQDTRDPRSRPTPEKQPIQLSAGGLRCSRALSG
jgi:hypothetical protein